MKIALMGATGQTGQLVLAQALAEGHTVTALVRTPSKLTTQHPNLRVEQGDVLRPSDVTRVVDGQDVVISVIGARTLKPDTICADSARNIIAAMQRTGVRRLICISGAALRDNAGFIIQNIVQPLLLRNVYADAVAQDSLIASSDLDWTIVRPYRLTTTVAPPAYSVSDAPFRSPLLLRWTRRSDVADFMVREAQANAYVRRKAYISTGSL